MIRDGEADRSVNMHGAISCVNHADRPAVFECASCRTHACGDCAKHVWTPKGFVDECPACHVPMQVIGKTVARMREAAERPDPGAAAYLRRIPEFLAFPSNRSVLLMVIGTTLLTAPLYWAVANNMAPYLVLLGVILIKSLEASLYFRFVTQTAWGVRDITPPDVTDISEDLIGPLFRYVVATLPILIAAGWYGEVEHGSILAGLLTLELHARAIFDQTGPGILFAVGLLLLPLLTVIAAVSRSAFAVLNPAIWVSSLQIVGSTYVVAVLAFYGVLAFEHLALMPVILKLKIAHSIPVLTTLLCLVLAYLSMALRARLLGGLCEPYFRSEE